MGLSIFVIKTVCCKRQRQKKEEVGMEKKKISTKAWIFIAIGVLATFMMPQVSFIITPAVQSLSETYPDIAYSNILMLQTAVYLMIIPFSIISGIVTGTKLSYRTVACVSAILIGVGGLFPYFVQDHFWLIYASRFVCGAGEGLAFPLGSALIIEYFQGRRRNIIQGISMFVLNISGVVYQNVSGYLCTQNVGLIWLLHACLIIPLVLMLLFLKDPEKVSVEDKAMIAGATEEEIQAANTDQEKDEGQKPSRHPRAFWLTAAFGIMFIPYYAILLNMSQMLDYRDIGDAATAGMVASCYTVAGLVSAFLYPVLFPIFKKFLVPFAIVLGLIGVLFAFIGNSVIMMMLAELFIGFSAFLVWPACLRDYAAMTNQRGVMFYSGLFAAFWNLGATISGYWISGWYAFIGEQNPVSFAGASVVFGAIVIVIWIIIRLRRPAELEADYKYK